MLRRVLKSESLRSAIGFGAGGIGFAVGNIVLAKVLSPASFGVVSLALALNQFGVTFGPFGLEIVANRHRPRIGRRLTAMSLTAAMITAAIVAAVAALYYRLSKPIVAMLFAMVIGSAANRVCVALFQGNHKMRAAMLLTQVHNYVLLLAAALAILFAQPTDRFVVAIATIGYLISMAVGWWIAYLTVNEGRREIDSSVAIREGLAALGIGVAVQILSQFERFAIPKVASIELLGTYAVLVAVVGSPFRMIQIGTSFSLLPRLRSVSTAAAARGVLLRETATALAVSVASAAAIAVVAPFIFQRILSSKYAIDAGLIAATMVVGLVKVWEGFSTTIVSSCGSSRSLGAISVLAWLCLALALVTVPFGARFGLVGIIYGVGAAWVVLCLGGTWLAVSSFHARFGSAGVQEPSSGRSGGRGAHPRTGS